MALGQTDPARLQGEDLRRWYSRTPAEIVAERTAAAKQAYNTFFSRLGGEVLSDLGASPAITPASSNPRGAPAPVAAPSRGFWNYWSPQGCASCHGYTPGTLPPLGGQSPLPPTYSPRSGGANGQGGSRPHRDDREECHQQYASDSQICARLRSPRDIAICRDTASKRYANCLPIDGRLDFPALETRGGRRP